MHSFIKQKLREQASFDSGKWVAPTQLPRETALDIANEMVDRFIPEYKDMNPNTLAEELHGTVTKNLYLWDASVEELYDQMDENRYVSPLAVSNLQDKIEDSSDEDLDPILTYNGKFLDGGHRLTVYYNLGRETIPAADIAKLVEDEREEARSEEE